MLGRQELRRLRARVWTHFRRLPQSEPLPGLKNYGKNYKQAINFQSRPVMHEVLLVFLLIDLNLS